MPSASPVSHSFRYEGNEATGPFDHGLSGMPFSHNVALPAQAPSEAYLSEENQKTYTTLEPTMKGMSTMSEDGDDFPINPIKKDALLSPSVPEDSWMHVPPEEWSPANVLQFLYRVAEKYGVDPRGFNGQNFNDINGEAMCRMTARDFEQRDSQLGTKLYNAFQELKNETVCIQPNFTDHLPSIEVNNQLFIEQCSSGSEEESEMSVLPPIDVTFGSNKFNDLEHMGPIGLSLDNDFSMECDDPAPLHLGYTEAPKPSTTPCLQSPVVTSSLPQASLPVSGKLYPYFSHRSICETQPQPSITTPPRRGPGRPRKNPQDKIPKKYCKKNSEEKVLLWKFLRDILLNSSSNPRIIKWEDRTDAVFRIVNSEEVAKMWGNLKNNPKMSYEKMSRAIRFCRDRGFFSEVPKDTKRNFPKKLCFRFGEKAYGWK